LSADDATTETWRSHDGKHTAASTLLQKLKRSMSKQCIFTEFLRSGKRKIAKNKRDDKQEK